MSTTPESGSRELGLDLDLAFLPAWAQRPSTENKYAKYEGGDDDRPGRRGDRGDRRGPRRDRPPRRDQGGQPNRGEGPSQGGGRPGGPRREGFRPGGRHARPERREPLPPPIEIGVTFVPEEKGVESLARQIRLTGRAYPLFDIASLILKKPDRYEVRLNVIKKADGQTAQPLFVCGLDDTVWLSEQEAVDYVLDKHFATFYQAEKSPADPPKGTYTFVAQCGMTGTILGPPNYHDYQNKIRKLHSERFSRMPFEVFKSRIKIVKDEATVKKWLEDQSWKTDYICLNVPESLKLGSREEVERHFREVHLPNVIKSVEAHTFNGTAIGQQPCRPLQNLVRRNLDDQSRFPLKVVNVLSQQFAGHGLQFFKVNKSVTHVAVARPRYLDLDVTPVSDGVRKIVDFIKETTNCSRRKILEALVPAVSLTPAAMGDPAAAAATTGDASAATPPSPEAAAVISDLHWLIHQGHVIEFANGLIELAKKPAPKPQKQEKAPAGAAAGAQEGTEGAVEGEASTESPIPGAQAEVSGASQGDQPQAATPSEAPAPSESAAAPLTESAPSPEAENKPQS